MRPERRWRVTVAALAVVLLAALVGSAAAQDNCPPTSNNPACQDGDSEDPGDQADPPAEEPTERSPIHTETEEEPPPAEDDGSDAATDGSSPGDPETDGASEEAPPPPPDLGPRRIVSSRFAPDGTAVDLRVVVDERDARGVDGGWTITVTVDGVPGLLHVVGLQPPREARTVARSATGQFALDGPQRLFGVFGQTSAERYAGRYVARGSLELDTDGSEQEPPTITITLFQ